MILLDTCTIIWDALDPSRMSKQARRAIEQADARDALAVSDISFWEIAMLVQKGRLKLQDSSSQLVNLYLQARSVSVKAISPEIAELSAGFGPEINNDPADRIIAASTIIYNARLVTADENLLGNKLVDTIW